MGVPQFQHCHVAIDKFVSRFYGCVVTSTFIFTHSGMDPSNPSSRSTRITNLRFVLFGFQLVDNVPLILMRNSYELRVTPPSHNHIILVDKLDARECKCLTNCSRSVSMQVSFSGQYLHLSQVASPLIVSPTFPPEFRYVTFRSVETPVEYRPLDARTRLPPVSTIDAIVPPCNIPRRLVCCFSIGSSK